MPRMSLRCCQRSGLQYCGTLRTACVEIPDSGVCECVLVSGMTNFGAEFDAAMKECKDKMTIGCVVHGLNRISIFSTQMEAVWKHLDADALVTFIGRLRKSKRA